MENKKPLVIVPPMSEPLQKLNEVLESIANDENIEISIIDNELELTQFVGSAGQCLVVFSSAKKCALFLQENRFLLAKFHTKVMLLTPKEIPSKVLSKFTKLGLTEAILETAPPKTLLYKVKLLLRSIKASSITPEEDKNHVVKSMIDTNHATGFKGEISIERPSIHTDENAKEAETQSEQVEIKVDKEENNIELKDNMKGKNTVSDDVIETHWKTKRKLDEGSLFDVDYSSHKKEHKNTNDVDLYYHGEKKSDPIEFFEQEDTYGKKKSNTFEDDLSENYLKTKHVEETTLDFSSNKKEKEKQNQLSENEDAGYTLKKVEEHNIFDSESNPPIEKNFEYEEAQREAKKKEISELDALFEEAKKRQKEQETVEASEYYKGKINQETVLELEKEDNNHTAPKEYDNSENSKNRSEKSPELNLFSDHKERSFHNSEESDNEEKKKGKENTIQSLLDEEGRADTATTLDAIDKENNREAKNIQEIDLLSENKNTIDEDGINYEKENASKTRSNNTEIEFSTEKNKDQENQYSPEDDNRIQRVESLISNDRNSTNSKQNDQMEDLVSGSDIEHAKSVDLNFEDADKNSRKNKNDEQSEYMSYKKINDHDIEFEHDNTQKTSSQKVDQIETYYRSGDGKQTNHNWDNLTEDNRIINIGATKREKVNKDEDLLLTRKDAGEIAIDYRKLKEEFDAISKNSSHSDKSGGSHKSGSSDDDEDGSFKVIDLDARGFDFGIEVINLIYQKESKPADFYNLISRELISRYSAYPVFYNYKANDKKHNEVFNSFLKISTPMVSEELINWWSTYKNEESLFADYYSKSMTTWICRDISNKGSTGHWEDVELPAWAQNELANKKVELVFPYYDGVDRMGVAVVFFPNGLNPKFEKGIEVTLEMVRTILLESIQRTKAVDQNDNESLDFEKSDKKNILNMFSGFFKGNKAG